MNAKGEILNRKIEISSYDATPVSTRYIDNPASQLVFNTTNLPPGRYTLRARLF